MTFNEEKHGITTNDQGCQCQYTYQKDSRETAAGIRILNSAFCPNLETPSMIDIWPEALLTVNYVSIQYNFISVNKLAHVTAIIKKLIRLKTNYDNYCE